MPHYYHHHHPPRLALLTHQLPLSLCHSTLNKKSWRRSQAGTYFAGGMEGIWGFVDGTFCAACHPAGNDEAQREAYFGYKKQHGQNWQAIVTLDGLILFLVGPFFGPANQ